MLTETDKLTQQIQLYMEHKAARDHAIEAMEFAKDKIAEYMNASDESAVRVPYNETHDIKATLKLASSTKLDKEGIAEELKVAPSSINRDLLLKSVDDRKLTFQNYKKFQYLETGEKVSVRLAKVEG